MRSWVVAIAAVLFLEMPAAADDKSVIAVLPLAAGEAHGLYAKPVADELARQLRSRGGLEVESLSLAGSIPARVALVIDGRIVEAGRRKVTLEARVRDPRRGTVMVATVATKARAVGDIDVLAGELAGALAPRVSEALAEQRKIAAAEAEAAKAKQPVAPPPGDAPPPLSPPPKGEGKRDTRPAMLVLRARGGDAELITRHGYWLAERLGHRAVPAAHDAAVDPVQLPELLAAAGASYALAIDLRGVSFDRRGVLTARGRARVVLYDRTGRALFDRVARTGTVVGSRGDGPAALVHFVGEQMADIAYPHLKKLVAR